MNTSPASGVSSPAMTRRSVDLPLPLGPSSPVSEPLSTEMETSSSARKSPNRFVTLRASIATLHHRHEKERRDREHRQQHGRRVGARLVEVLVRRLDILREGLGAPGDAARHDADRAELTERAGGREDDAVRDGPPDGGQRDPPEGRERRSAERRGRLLLLRANLAQHRYDLAHD